MPEPLSHPPPEPAPGAEPAPRRYEHAERQLLARIALRELTAFDALYRAYHPRLWRFLDRMTHRPALVDELINDTMFVVWTHAVRFDGSSKVSTWIFGIAYRCALKALREMDEPLDDDQAELRPSDALGPEQTLSQQQVQQRLLRALRGLSAEQRAVVDLTYYHGADYREIALIVDCPLATVKTRMFHARRRLKTLLSGSLGDWL